MGFHHESDSKETVKMTFPNLVLKLIEIFNCTYLWFYAFLMVSLKPDPLEIANLPTRCLK